jgi:hypothetical protein
MKVSLAGKKIVVWDGTGSHSHDNLCFNPNIAKEKWYNFSISYLYEECQKRGIQLITPDIYFNLSVKPKSICVRDRSDVDMRVSLALRRSGVKLALLKNSEQPLYACRFFWNLKRLSSYFDHSEIVSGVKSWVSPRSRFRSWFNPHAYFNHVHDVDSNFSQKKFLVLMQSNVRLHWLRHLYVNIMNSVKPMPNFINREGYKSRLEAIHYFSKYSDFHLYGFGWDKPVRYTHKYNQAIKKSYRGSVDDKFKTLQNYKFSLVFDNAYLGGLVYYMNDSLYAGSVPVYWGAPDVSSIFPENCFIDFRKFNCSFIELDEYLRGMDENTYNGYINNIRAFINSPTGGYTLSQEKYVADIISLFESYF